MNSGLENRIGCWVCPSIVPSGEAVKAAFTKEGDIFNALGIQYMNPFLNLAEPRLFELQMFNAFKSKLGLTRKENIRAIQKGFDALEEYRCNMRQQSRHVLTRLEQNNEIGIVLLGRPYHKRPWN